MASDYKSIAGKIKFEGRAFIDGKYVEAIDGEKFENIIQQRVKLFVQFLNVIIKTLI